MAKKYFLDIGAREDSTFIAINTVDTSFFESETQKAKLNSTSDTIKHLIYVGYLSPRKNVSLLLQAIRKLAGHRNDFVLDIIGDGEERGLLESLAEEWGIQSKVVFHGFHQKQELPLFFAKGCMFLFQTDFDIWGLVLNEAMAAGLPCLVSPNAGSAADLIVEGQTGYVCNYNDVESVVAKIEFLLDNPTEVERIGHNARAFVREYATIEKSATGFIQAVLKTQK